MIYEGPPEGGDATEQVVEEQVVAHLDGRDYMTRDQMTARGLEPWTRKVFVGGCVYVILFLWVWVYIIYVCVCVDVWMCVACRFGWLLDGLECCGRRLPESLTHSID
jgi:hypothetical protein